MSAFPRCKGARSWSAVVVCSDFGVGDGVMGAEVRVYCVCALVYCQAVELWWRWRMNMVLEGALDVCGVCNRL